MKMNDSKLKFCPDLTQVVWEKAMMVGNGDYQRIQLNKCIKRHDAYLRWKEKCKEIRKHTLEVMARAKEKKNG